MAVNAFGIRSAQPQTSHPAMRFESIYHDIVPNERIVHSSTLSAGDELATVSLTSVALHPSADGTKLLLTVQGTFLDGREEPAGGKKAPASS